MTACETELPFDLHSPRQLDVQFSDLTLSSDAGILLVRQADERLGVSALIADAIEEWRDPAKLTHSLINWEFCGWRIWLQRRLRQCYMGIVRLNRDRTR